MKASLKPVLSMFSITGGEAAVLGFLAVAGLSCCAWGVWQGPPLDWQNGASFLHNIPLLGGLGTLALTFLVYLGCMHEPDRRSLMICALVSVLAHLGLFLTFGDAIVGVKPGVEREVALNLQPKPPVIVNDYYFGELPGDEAFADSLAIKNEEDERESAAEGDVKGDAEDDAVSGLFPTFPQAMSEEAIQSELDRTAETHEVLETEAEAESEGVSSEARAMAEDLQLPDVEAPESGLSERQDARKPESFVDSRTLDRNVSAAGVIGADGLSADVKPETAPLVSAEAAQREKVNLREEARKKQAERSGFSKKLEGGQKKMQGVNRPETASGSPRGDAKRTEIRSDLEHSGENIVSGAAQNWGETPAEKSAGGAGKAMGEIRSGLGEVQAPAAGAASLNVSKKKSKKNGDSRRVLHVSDAPKKVKGGQTLGARAGENENLDAVLAGAVNGVSDAVLETTAIPERVAGSNVLETERDEILKNIVVFRFEEPKEPEMGFRPDSFENRGEIDSAVLGTDSAENSDGEDVAPQTVVTSEDLSPMGGLLPDRNLHAQPSLPYRQRMRQNHRKQIEAAGGNPLSEQVVEQGLQFLERTQFSDGHWSMNHLPQALPDGLSPEDVGFGSIHADTAATGLALLSYLGAGHTHLESENENDYTQVVHRGLKWLIQNQQPDGSLFQPKTDAHRCARIYSHGIASIALCEAYGMTRDPQLREPAQRAINFIVQSQTPLGGWRYTPEKKDGVWRGESDTSVSGWQAMALVSARMAGLEVPESSFQKLDLWIRHAALDGGARFCYMPIENPLNDEMKAWRKPSYAMTAEGLLMELYLNYDPKNPKFQEAVDYMMTNLPTVTKKKRDTYYWYYATQVLFHVHDSRWMEWQKNLVTALQSSQESKNELLRGSWDPNGPAPDHWGMLCGRHYVTTMHLLMLEVYYRHLPLFRELNNDQTEKIP